MKERSNLNIIIRLVLFAVLIALGAAAFSIAFMQLTKQKTGFQIIDEYPSEDAKRYGLDFEFYYDLQGENSEIKEQKKALAELYSNRLMYLYKLTDPENEYENMSNIATINNNAGTPVEVDETLYNMLEKAYILTGAYKSYNILSGAFYKYYTEFIYADDPLSDDPIVNAESRALIASVLDAETKSGAELMFNEADHTVTLYISNGYKSNEYTEDMPVIDLNYLRNAFIVNDLKNTIEGKGYEKGFILTKDGVSAALSSFNSGDYVLKGKDDKEDTVAITGGSVTFTLNPYDDKNKAIGEYEITDADGNTYFRTPNILYTELGVTNRVISSMTLDTNGDAVNCKLAGMTFNTDLAVGEDARKSAEGVERAYGVNVYYNEN